MAKRPFIRKPKRKKHGATFWDNEYAKGGHLKLSTAESEDLAKFTRWLERQQGKELLNPTSSALDLGCGNGRNLIYLAHEYGIHGTGFDISSSAIAQAKAASKDFQLTYDARSIAGDLPIKDESQTFVLDMMTSHFLNEKERLHLREEVYRVMKPGGWLFMKTFLGDGDLHTRRLLREFPTKEEGTYTHPVMGMPEHVYFEEELTNFLSECFTIHRIQRSHKHVSKGRAKKRRTISIYAEKAAY